MGDFNAILPGTDLSRHARDLRRVHHAVLSGGRTPLRPRAVVARSWTRVLCAGLDPDRANARDPHRPDEIERRRRESPLHAVIDELAPVIRDVALMVVTDADGVILWRDGAPSALRSADRLGFREGARWTVGLCLPERLAEGWLVRPAGRSRGIRATLDLAGSPVLSVTGEGEPWRSPLTRRHAEILALLHAAGRPGLTAVRLSRALYGDDEHVVTVRAEVSRLRRAIGALVATNPYRLADGVVLELAG